MFAGAVAQAAAWWSVSSGRGTIWRVVPATVGAAGIAAVLARRPVWAGEVGALRALVVGLASGAALYAATRAFVWIATWWEPFRLDVVKQYGRAAAIPAAQALGWSLVIAAPAEELFWRGLFQAHLAGVWMPAAAAGVTWLAYAAVNGASRSMPILAGAIVGGGVWAALGWWSGGVLTSLASHILWTGLMLLVPPGAGRWAGGSA
jgi:membrane protease YdiL (CAAX protease family)